MQSGICLMMCVSVCVCVCGKEGPILCRVINLVGELPYHLWVYVCEREGSVFDR